MSPSENMPRYTHAQHLREYDQAYIGKTGAELELLTVQMDDILYPESDKETVVSASSAQATDGFIQTQFRHEFLRADRIGWCWPLESVRVSIDHAMYLGRGALKQCYKVHIDSSVLQQTVKDEKLVALKNRITSIYYLEETAGTTNRFIGSILRPNIIGEASHSDESMTAYDCERLMDVLAELSNIAIYDDREAKALR